MHVQMSRWPPCQERETWHFGNTIHVILLNTLACYTRQLIHLRTPQLIFVRKFFRARLCNKRALVRNGTGYPSNQGPMGVIVLGYAHGLKNARGMYYLVYRANFGLLISQRRHMASAAVNGLNTPDCRLDFTFM